MGALANAMAKLTGERLYDQPFVSHTMKMG
jgi:hypothetical protein